MDSINITSVRPAPRKGWASGTETTSADLRGKERNAIITKALSQEQWEVKDQIKGALLENEKKYYVKVTVCEKALHPIYSGVLS